MYDFVVLCTFIALIIFFAVVEVYKSKTYIKGMIVDFCHSDIGVEKLITSRIKVKLENSQIVEAEAMSCTMCLGHFAVGDEVKLTKSKDKYIVNLPLGLSKNKLCNIENFSYKSRKKWRL